ncbi:hypothetical protein [Halobaculum saliterrae]|nr:hypothetical protein [Halobaculum saliterrae]
MSDDTAHDGDEDHERSDAGDGPDAGMNEAVSRFLAGADDVYGDYDRGYVDADAALSVLSSRIDDLRDAAEAVESAEADDGAGDE